MKTLLEMILVMQYYKIHGEGSVEFSKTDVWVCAEPLWNWEEYTYRIIRTQDTIDWSHIHPCYQWMARNETDEAHLFSTKPEISKYFSWHSKSGNVVTTSSHVSYKQGTCDWRDSLVCREK